MKSREIIGNASEVLSAMKKDEIIAKAGRLFWSGVGLYSINKIVKHTHLLGLIEANKDFIEWVDGQNEKSGE